MVADFLDEEILENPHLDVAEDYYIWLQLAERGRIIFCPEIVATIYEHGVEQSNYKEDNLANNQQHARIAKRMLGRRFKAIEAYRPNPRMNIQQCDHLKAVHNFLNHDIYDEKLVFSPTPPFIGRGNDSYCTFTDIVAGTYRFNIVMQPGSPDAEKVTKLVVTSSKRRQTVPLRRSDTAMDLEGEVYDASFVILADESTDPVEILLPLGSHENVVGCFWALDNSKRLVPLSALKAYRRVWLYGASNFSEIGNDLLAGLGLVPCGIADTYQTGSWKGHTILSPNQLKSQLRPGDGILVTSYYWKEINKALKDMEVWTDCLTIYDLNVSADDMRLLFMY